MSRITAAQELYVVVVAMVTLRFSGSWVDSVLRPGRRCDPSVLSPVSRKRWAAHIREMTDE